MALTDTAIRLTKPAEKPIRKTDGNGLVLLINPNGSRWWRFRYRFHGKAKMISIGTYPEVSLSAARAKREEYRAMVARGVDPSIEKQAVRSAQNDSFQAIADEWFQKHGKQWAEAHAKRVKERLTNHVYPYIGERPIATIGVRDIRSILDRMTDAGKIESAHKTKQTLGQIFRYAVATERAEKDPIPSLKDVLPSADTKHFPALLDDKQIGAALRQFESYGGFPPVRAGLKLGPYLFCRPGELRKMRWSEIDFEKAEWRFTASKTKTDHIVPLARQAIEIIKDLQPLTGKGLFVMPSQRSPKGDRPMSDAAITAAYRAMGIDKNDLVAHGWRATARTKLVEDLGVRQDFVEHQLGHMVKDPNGRAYNRTTFLDERRIMMQRWADYLDSLKTLF